MMTVQGQRLLKYEMPAVKYVSQCVVGIFDMCRRANPERPFHDWESANYRLMSFAIGCLPHLPALPDYSARPLDSDAIRYTRGALIEHDGLIILGASPCQYDPMAVEVWFSLRGWPAGDEVSMTVWYETREDGSRYLYGEW